MEIMKVIEAKIYMKNGQEIVVYLKTISTPGRSKDALISKLSWENASLDLPGILTIDVDEIIAITVKEVEIGSEKK